jgi:osmotically-inducible protein OsmY
MMVTLKKTTTGTMWLGAGVVALLGVVGCADRNKDNIPESPATSTEMSKSVDKAGKSVENAAKGAGKAVEGMADAAVNTPKIKSALAANAALKGSNIDVDTQGSKDTVYLKGTVRNAAQSKAAATIAKKNAPNYKIVNQLKVAAGGAAKPAKKS